MGGLAALMGPVPHTPMNRLHTTCAYLVQTDVPPLTGNTGEVQSGAPEKRERHFRWAHGVRPVG